MRPIEFTSKELSREVRLRVAVVTETFPPEINGVALSLKKMVDGLTGRGHSVQLIRPRQFTGEAALRSPEIDEILANGLKIPRYDGLRFGLPAKAALMRTWSRRMPDLVHVATEGPLGWSAVSAALKLGIPVTSDLHTNFDHYSRHYGMGWFSKSVATYLRRFHNRTAVTFVPTAEMAESLRTQGYRRVEVIARGVDTELFSPEKRDEGLRRTWGVDRGDLVVACVGRLAPEKNLHLAIRAYKAIRTLDSRVRLVLVGDGPLREALARENPDVVFAGMRTGDDLAAHYASADLFLFPSLTETFGNVTLEAMATGLGVLAYDYAAAGEVIRSGTNGISIAVGDEAGFVAAALRLAGDARFRARLGVDARLCAERLGWEEVNDQFEAALVRVWQDASRKACSATRAQPVGSGG